MKILNLLFFLLAFTVFGQDASVIEELNKKRKESPTIQPIPGKGLLVSYNSIDYKSQLDYTLSWNFVFYDLDLKQQWKQTGLSRFSITSQEEAMRLYRMLSSQLGSFHITEDNSHLYLHNPVENQVTVIDLATGQFSVGESKLKLSEGEETGFLHCNVSESDFVVSYITYTNKKSETGEFMPELRVARYNTDLEEDIQEVEIKAAGSSKHKIRVLSSSSPTSRKWEIMGASNEYVLLQDSYLLYDDKKNQNYRRLLSVDASGEAIEILIPFGGYDPKNERYFGETFCSDGTGNKLYNIYIDPQSDKTGNINVQVIDLDLTLLAETSISTSSKLSDIQSVFELRSALKGGHKIVNEHDEDLYSIEIVAKGDSEIIHAKTEVDKSDCVKNNKYVLQCDDYEAIKSGFEGLQTFITNDEKKTKKWVSVDFWNSGNSVYLLKASSGLLGDRFYEIHRFPSN